MELSFAQAINDARQVIVQQAARIKSDSDKIRVHQDMLTAQGATIGEQERQIKERSAELDRLLVQIDDLTHRLTEATTAKDQAEAIINRQGERVQSLQASVAELEKTVSMQSERIHGLEREKESLMEKLPTREDTEALAGLSALLSKKVSATVAPLRQGPQMRLADAA